ncbi:MAG: D-glycerate dehydrogenase [Nanoarchaeota archaeon]|nr:D-glycerate dehydrogenase [Nanoarchaeota archaeon]MBU1632399.1 D-glycerate dehydrogenase [Nanoarchaeota archaeon]MBU1875859.1 D-glycerate dehydrogenase [Nanoarchaeota archaeon]
MKPKIFITGKIPEKGLKFLQDSCQVKVYSKNQVISQKELIKGVKWCDALLCLLTDKINKKIVDVNPNLKIISNYAVGYNNIDIKYATKKGIPVTNTPGVLTDAVAEHTFALLLAVARRISESDKLIRAGKCNDWEPMLLLGSQMKSKTLGVIGLGKIGAGVAERAHKSIGVNVLYHDIKRNSKFEREYKAKFVSLNDLLKKSDFITLHIPLLPSTKHLIGKKGLSMMKKTAYLINTSRGPVIDEEALVQALKRKQIAGAALDVFENEPKLSPGLAKLDNVVLTPHTASATVEARTAMSELATKNILAVLSGKKAEFTVNPEVYRKR